MAVHAEPADLPFVASLARSRTRLVKRALDAGLASLALMLLSPFMLLIAFAVKLTSPGPAIFRQVRIGEGRVPFVMFKFRTMYHGADDAQHRAYVTSLITEDSSRDGGEPGLYKLSDDDRITRLGRFLRRSSLDELPQLLNVLRGDMSLVGPRPALPYEVELFRPEHNVRFSVPAGITGLWQVSGRNALTIMEGLELDAEYVVRQSIALDLIILLKTHLMVVTGRGAR